MIPLAVIAFVLDWHSTIIQSPAGEENPFMKWVWVEGGDIGFTLVSILGLLLFIYFAKKLGKLAWIALPLIVIKILIALTNYNLIPYSWMSWLQFPS